MSKCAKPAGAISYTIVNQYGISPEVEFVYDLELPSNFVPKNIDGEVQGTLIATFNLRRAYYLIINFKPLFKLLFKGAGGGPRSWDGQNRVIYRS